MTRALAIAIGSFLAVNVYAATFRLEQESKPLPGDEVCLFDAKSPDGPLERLTTFTKVECFPADGDVPLPGGTWNVFARSRWAYL